MKTDWLSYWAGKADGGHPWHTPEYYLGQAQEFRLLYSGLDPRSVLEFGCGAGELYAYMGFDALDYLGVDASASMLAEFRSRYPTARTVQADATRFCRPETTYDLIFSNQMLQYLDLPAVSAHFANVRRMMAGHSVFLCGCIPHRAMRKLFYSGEFDEVPRTRLQKLGGVARWLLRPDYVGYWHDPRSVSALAAKYGMTSGIYGCMYFPYRFHAVMRLTPA